MPVPVITVEQMREWEKATWATGKTEAEVISRVGEIIAQRVRELVAPRALVLILAGKGHNGDDALAAKDHLADLRVEVCPVSDPEGAIPEINQFLAQHPALIVDGLFGIGLNRPLDDQWKKLIQLINASQIPVLSVDVPSGLNADTGEPQGAAIQAAVTLTLAAPKRGFLLHPAWPYVGRLEVAPDIGLVECPVIGETLWSLPEDFKDFPPLRPAVSNKGDYGRLMIIAGSSGYHGAAVLCSRGAQRAHPGLITVHTPSPVYPLIASQLQAVMASPWQPNLKMPGDSDAVLIGPGLAAPDLPPTIRDAVDYLWEQSPVPVIVDATAIDWIPAGLMSDNLIRVITPHPGEAARLLRMRPSEIQENRPEALREISRRLGSCWVVLKGAQTLIGRNEGEIFVNPTGNAQLAQGGSGDLLSGFIAGLLAQPALQKNPGKTIRYAVWEHGAAADRLAGARKNWVVEDLAAELGNGPLSRETILSVPNY